MSHAPAKNAKNIRRSFFFPLRPQCKTGHCWQSFFILLDKPKFSLGGSFSVSS
jgi:hypothetical protein